MKPAFLDRLENVFAENRHAILVLNTEDRFHYPEASLAPQSLAFFLAQYFGKGGFRVAQYSPSTGVRDITPDGQPSPSVTRLNSASDPVATLNGLSALLRDANQKWIVLIQHAERLAPPAGAPPAGSYQNHPFAEMLHSLALDENIAAGGSRMVLVTYTNPPDDLLVRCPRFGMVEVGLPSREERRGFISLLAGLAERRRQEFGQLAVDVTVDSFADLSSGMPLVNIEAAFRAAGRTGENITRERIREIKARAIRNIARDLLEVSEPQEGFDGVAGLYGIKEYFASLIPSIKACRPGVPQGILLQGVPGCGKSHLVKALANELAWPLVEMRNVRAPYVGQSESNLEHVIRIVEELEPVVLYMDELDQTVGQRGTGASGDSGTNERMLGRIFNWMGSLHLRGRVLFVGATNRPDILDTALMDRFGVFIPFIKPGLEELSELIPICLSRFERSLEGITAQEAASMLFPHSPTGRAVQEIIIEAGFAADRENGNVPSPIRRGHLEWALSDRIGAENELEMEFLSLVSLSLASSQSLLPWNDRRGLRSGAQIPQGLIQNGVVNREGRLEKARILELVQELKGRRHSQRIYR